MDPKAIAEALQERWADHLEEGESFEAKLSAENGEARALLAVVGTDEAERFEFEVVASIGTMKAERAKDLVLDAADAVLGEWLEDGRPRLRGKTEERDYEGTPVAVTARRISPRLEAEADRLLGETDEGGLDS